MAALGGFWGAPGRFWVSPGHILRVLGAYWGALGRSWGALGALLGRSWDALGTLGSLLGASWTPLGRYLENCWGGPRSWGSTWEPKSTQVGSKILKKKRVKTNIDFEAFFVVLFMFFFDFHGRTKIVDFEKIAFSLRKNTFFGVQTVLGKTHVWTLRLSTESDFRAKKPSKMKVKIH